MSAREPKNALPRLTVSRRFVGIAALLLMAMLAVTMTTMVLGQRRSFSGALPDQGFDPRPLASTTMDFPTWEPSPDMPEDIFTFARLRYPSTQRAFGVEKWATDYPDADLNFSFRLQQLTSLAVNPNPVVVEIDHEQLRHLPFVYMVEPGDILLSDDQARILREWMLNGGFLFVDDFWGYREWDVFERRGLKHIFPDREYEELELEHEIFHVVFDLDHKPQVPAAGLAIANPHITFEDRKPGSKDVHYRAIRDDKGRICMLIAFNTDLGDGWEREGDNAWYFKEFSEKRSFPMGINVVFYAMTR